MDTNPVEKPGPASVAPSTPGADTPAPAFRLKKILVPTDFSDCSVKALNYALAFAKHSQAEILLLHVVEPIAYPVYGQEIPADWTAIQTDLLDASRDHLREFSRTKAAEYGPVKQILCENSACDGIIETARTEAVDLIIISTHGRTGLRHALLGSTAERVVRHAPCPVLTVREREHEFIA